MTWEWWEAPGAPTLGSWAFLLGFLLHCPLALGPEHLEPPHLPAHTYTHMDLPPGGGVSLLHTHTLHRSLFPTHRPLGLVGPGGTLSLHYLFLLCSSLHTWRLPTTWCQNTGTSLGMPHLEAFSAWVCPWLEIRIWCPTSPLPPYTPLFTFHTRRQREQWRWTGGCVPRHTYRESDPGTPVPELP